MQAHAVVAVHPRRVEFQTIEIAEPGEWDLLVELECSAISVGTESFILTLAQPDKPLVIGYAPVGRIVSVGSKAAERFRAGERVTYFAPSPPKGIAQLCGGHQSPAVVSVDPRRDPLAPNAYCVKVPEGVPSERAAFAGIAAVSYLGVVMPNPMPGEKVAVVGQGIIGLFATQHFALRGVEVLAVDIDDRRLELARQCGATASVNPGTGDVGGAIRGVWPGGADIVADATASHRVVESAVGGLRHEGKFVFLGYYKGADFNLGRLHGVVFNAYFPWTLRGNLVAASLRLMERGALKVNELISHRFKASDAAGAFELVGRRPVEYTGVLLDWRS